jgi:site-specific DNA recombinase
LYARKSTEDENRQVRSIEDQIRDCIALAEREGLRVVATIKEKKSAKKPGQRPQFTQMLADIGKKYDAILAWHPDRLCRNMLEGGQIINMLDESVLKISASIAINLAMTPTARCCSACYSCSPSSILMTCQRR